MSKTHDVRKQQWWLYEGLLLHAGILFLHIDVQTKKRKSEKHKMEHVIGVVLFPELQKVKPEVNLGDFFFFFKQMYF